MEFKDFLNGGIQMDMNLIEAETKERIIIPERKSKAKNKRKRQYFQRESEEDSDFPSDLLLTTQEEHENSIHNQSVEFVNEIASKFKKRKTNENWKLTSSLPNNALKELIDNFDSNVTPGPITQVSTPYEAFSLFFDSEVIRLICDNSNIYAKQQKEKEMDKRAKNKKKIEGTQIGERNKCLNYGFERYKRAGINESDIKAYIAIILLMGLRVQHEQESHWADDPLYSNSKIKSIMDLTHFKMLKKFLHLCDNEKDISDKDPFYKVSKLMSLLVNKFEKHYIPSQNMSIDESMIAFKGRSKLRFYCPRKPKRYGFKLHALCEPTGYCFNMALDPGVEFRKQYKHCTSLTYKNQIVLELVSPLAGKGYITHMDTWYTSPLLFSLLAEAGTGANGTLSPLLRIFPSSFPQPSLTNNTNHTNKHKDKPKQKEKDNASLLETESASNENVIVSASNQELLWLKWMDRREVCCLSSVHHATMVYSNNKRKMVPDVVKQYALAMGGVDTMDQLISYYRFPHKSRRWWIAIFIHTLEMCVVNARVLYQKSLKEEIKHIKFRESIIDGLVQGYQILCKRKKKNIIVNGMGEKCGCNKIKESFGSVFIDISQLHRMIGERGEGRCKDCGEKTSIYRCANCEENPFLCPECFTAYHNQIYTRRTAKEIKMKLDFEEKSTEVLE